VTHPLDRPAWNALTTRQTAFADGNPLAWRFRPELIPFAAARDDSPEAIDALGALPDPGEHMTLAELHEPIVPPGFAPFIAAQIVQMLAAKIPPPVEDKRIELLSDADAAEMLELATLAKPGPFTLKAQALGEFYGVRVDGRIVAMAGERMKQEGYSELSGVCVHPDYRGQGLARLLSIFITHRIVARGDTPYLHAWASNTPAVTLYEAIGYATRVKLNVRVVRRGNRHDAHSPLANPSERT
jgi:ribosomal protein S18 acetylase RimI-like enzyme